MEFGSVDSGSRSELASARHISISSANSHSSSASRSPRLGPSTIEAARRSADKRHSSRNAEGSSSSSSPSFARRGLIQLGSNSLMARAAIAAQDGGGIGAPFNVQHVAHGAYNSATGALSGLDDATVAPTNLVFGSPISSQKRFKMPGYNDRIPAILVHLARHFRECNGLLTEGVFRIPPSTAEMNDLTKQLDLGRSLVECSPRDPILIAAVIKYWFRSLPVAVLSSVPPETISSLGNLNLGSTEALGTFTVARSNELIFKGVMYGHRVLPEPSRSTFAWALDLMAAIVSGSAKNKMSPKALAIVFAPSLYRPPKGTDPFTEMELIKKAGKFIENALVYTIRCDKRAARRDPFGGDALF